MDSVFYQSALILPPRIAGIQLKPLSCWHSLALYQFNNPYAIGGERSIADLIQMLLICKDSREPTESWLRRFVRMLLCRPLRDQHLSSYLRFTNSSFSRLLWSIRLLRYREDRLLIQADEYITAFTQSPDYYHDENPKQSRIPWPYLVVATILREYPSITQQEAWDMPLSYALCLRAVVAESNGADIVDPDEIAKIEEAVRAFDTKDLEKK